MNADKNFTAITAITARKLGLATKSYPVHVLERFKHLDGLPLQAFQKVPALFLMDSDHPHLVCPVEGVCLGPAAVHTRLGWALEGPTLQYHLAI